MKIAERKWKTTDSNIKKMKLEMCGKDKEKKKTMKSKK